jgi:hypothetical protein
MTAKENIVFIDEIAGEVARLVLDDQVCRASCCQSKCMRASGCVSRLL